MFISYDNLFRELVEHLDVTSPDIQRMRQGVLAACRTRGGSEQIAWQLREQHAEFCACVDTLDNVPYCDMFFAYTSYRLNDFEQAVLYARRAAQGFGEMLAWNKAMALVGSALGRIQRARYTMAEQDLRQAIQKIKSCIRHEENLGNYKKVLKQKRILQMIEKVLQETGSLRRQTQRRHTTPSRLRAFTVLRRAERRSERAEREARAARLRMITLLWEFQLTLWGLRQIIRARQQRNSPALREIGLRLRYRKRSREAQQFQPIPSTSLFPSSPMIVGVQSFVVAGQSGTFVFDSQREDDGGIEEITFAGIRHRIYNVRNAGMPIFLHARVYRWLRVTGNSMNQANPIPISNNDYVLVVDTQLSDVQAQYGDIVVASIHSSTDLERAGVIKRYTPNGLRSETDSPTENISYPLEKIDVRGIVIAVAKPIATTQEAT